MIPIIGSVRSQQCLLPYDSSFMFVPFYFHRRVSVLCSLFEDDPSCIKLILLAVTSFQSPDILAEIHEQIFS